jgi:hypothetical protein
MGKIYFENGDFITVLEKPKTERKKTEKTFSFGKILLVILIVIIAFPLAGLITKNASK